MCQPANSTTNTQAFVDLPFVRAGLDAMSQGLIIVRLIGDKLMVVLCNRQAAAFYDIPPELAGQMHPYEDNIRRNAARGEYGPGNPEQHVHDIMERAKIFTPHSFNHMRPGGTVIEIVRTPLETGDGFVATYTDLGTRETTDLNSEIMMRALDGSRSGIRIFDADEKLIFFNASIHDANTSEDNSLMPGTPFEDCLRIMVKHGQINDAVGREDEWIAERLDRFRNPRGPFEIEGPDNHCFLVEDIKLPNGHTVIVSTDISALKSSQKAVLQAKRRAELASRVKTEFLANMSHELRTPLNSVIGFSELLLAGVGGTLQGTRAAEYLDDINRSGRHLLRLISDVLDISKIEVDELHLNEEPVSLSAVSAECLRMIQDRASRAGIRLLSAENTSTCRLLADATRLKQIILNLLTNAIKFSEPGNTVMLAWCAQDDRLVLEVQDEGPGMAAKNIAIALAPFGQIETSLTRKNEGAGLGLPLSRRLAELHQAKLEIESTEGVGTTVRIIFPPERVLSDATT